MCSFLALFSGFRHVTWLVIITSIPCGKGTLTITVFWTVVGWWRRGLQPCVLPSFAFWALWEICLIQGGLSGGEDYVIGSAHKDPTFPSRVIPKIGHHL